MRQAFRPQEKVDSSAIFLCLKEEKKKERKKEAKERRNKEACYVTLFPSGHFPAAGQVDVTLSKNNCETVQQ